MIKALMPVNADLESSIALRYAKTLSQRIDLLLHDIHIVEAGRVGTAPGSGWVRHTWENALIETASQEIRQFLEMENLKLKRLGETEIRIGDRTEKLLETLDEGEYQLFIEGALPTFNPLDFYSRIHSRLYRSMPCPALMVKNLVSPDRGAFLLENGDSSDLVSGFLNIFSSSGIRMDVIGYDLTRSSELAVKSTDVPPDWWDETARMLSDGGVRLDSNIHLKGTASQMAQHLRAYGLVAVSLPRNPRRHDPKTEILARVSSPVLIFWSKP